MAQEDNPLEGRRVVVTRAAEQSSELTARLEALGAEVLSLPLVRFAPAADLAPLDRALRELDRVDWVFLTSQNTVRFMAERGAALGLNLAAALSRSLPRPQVAAVGQATEQAALDRGWRVDCVSTGRGGADLARQLGQRVRGCCVLLPRSDRATPDLPQALVAAGAEPVEVVAYRTLPIESFDSAVLAAMAQGEADVVSFASPSAFATLATLLGETKFRALAAAVRFAAIGPTTASAIRRAGFPVAIEAKVPSAAGLAAAIAAHFSADSDTPGGHT